ncbi:APC family permease [Pseudonocardia spirodelae]|uniref:APC family permease n=1 Tax=Pseudonocardia spirodelae TaxID=3133431 RepID=A0ABU8T5L5_9PSEU
MDGGDRHRLGTITGVAALGLDALASCAYGPEAVVVALAVAGAAGLGAAPLVTAVIVGLLALLVLGYRQVIAAYPDGGGAYSVARRNLGPGAGLVAAASLVVDYVLNVAVSIAAGVAALTSAFPDLIGWTPALCLGALAVVTAVNLRGVVTGGRLFALPAAVFVGALAVVIVVGLLRDGPAETLPPAAPVVGAQEVGVLLLLAAFANGCAALTGVEAIANATPSFRADRRRRARDAELVLGVVLGLLLLGLGALVDRLGVAPTPDRTLLSLLVQASLGSGWIYVGVQLTTVVLLALAANTSYGGLPVLAARLAADDALPRMFAVRGDRQVYRASILSLSVLAAVLLLVTGGDVALLVPLFAIGVFVGFALCQAGMVVHHLRTGGPGARARVALCGTASALTAVAAVVLTVEKAAAGAWLVVVVVPMLVALFVAVRRGYAGMAARLAADRCTALPHGAPSVVVVPVAEIDVLAEHALSTARSMGRDTVAVHVVLGRDADDLAAADDLRRRWARWRPDVELVLLSGTDERGRPRRRLGPAVCGYLRALAAGGRDVTLLIPEPAPRRRRHAPLLGHRGAGLARYAARHTDAVVGRMRLRA